MVLYTCSQKKLGGSLGHPCGKAAKALDKTGHVYEIKVVRGGRAKPWTWAKREEDREEVRRLSGANEVPILLLDDGEVIAGSATIARWAHEYPASQS